MFYTKQAADPVPSTAFAGRLIASSSGWLLLSVPNAIVRGLFAAMNVPGIQLPYGRDGKLNAHISVARPEELESMGGVEKITERGKFFHFQIGKLQEVKPLGWADMDRVWFVSITSPELMDLRKSYGLNPLPTKGSKELKFHMTIAVRKKDVLKPNGISKDASTQVTVDFTAMGKLLLALIGPDFN